MVKYLSLLLIASYVAATVESAGLEPRQFGGRRFRGATGAGRARPVQVKTAGNQNKGDDSAVEVAKLPNGVPAFAPAATSAFCGQFADVQAADGTQFRDGGQSCSSMPQGLIPDVNQMVSTIIITPANGATINAAVDNVVRIDTANLETGFFSEANSQYYLAPQTLNQNGIIQGHQHISVQHLASPFVAPSATTFAFFKGINEAATDGRGRSLSATIPAGTLTANGLHRICSITGTSSHQPVIMPVAQRGSQDDCIRVNVVNAVPNPAAVGAAATGAGNQQARAVAGNQGAAAAANQGAAAAGAAAAAGGRRGGRKGAGGARRGRGGRRF